jgi:hypothetical protein
VVAASAIGYRSGRGLLVAGMVRANRPWRLMLGLSSALAAALATSAFGLTQDTIWLLADALGPWRLSLVALGSIATLVVWLIADHELWERRNGYAARLGHPIGLYNAATVITGLLGVVSLYVALVGAELPGSEVFTVNTVLADSLQHPVDRFRRRRGGTRSRPGQVQRFLATTASRSIPPATRARKMTRSMSSSTTRSMACLPVVRRAAGRGAAPRTGTTTATAEPTW